MREIKFRGWIKDEKLLIRDLSLFDFHSTYDVYMQFIGLTDKNGVDIYEGDILQTDQGNYKVYYYEPSFNLEKPHSEDYNNGDYYEGYDVYCHNWCEFEVIGNIYENPELLES